MNGHVSAFFVVGHLVVRILGPYCCYSLNACIVWIHPHTEFEFYVTISVCLMISSVHSFLSNHKIKSVVPNVSFASQKPSVDKIEWISSMLHTHVPKHQHVIQ